MEALLSALGLKKAVLLAGFLGGMVSGGILPGPLAVLQNVVVRIVAGALCGTALSAYGAQPLAQMLERPESIEGIALGLGLFGLSFAFKVVRAWNDFDLSAFINNRFGGGK